MRSTECDSAFDRHGDWSYEAPYGYVWYPRVAVGWRPYHYGKWSYHFQFGWFWVGIDRWSWPTHHYGRWGYSSGGWYWIPDRRWGPAWVAVSSSSHRTSTTACSPSAG